MNNQRGLKTILASIGMMVLASAASAQDYPSKPITLIVPWPAGGPTDVTMRSMAEAASKHLGQPIVIENKAGGGGTVGPATMAAAAKPDGYTIAQMPITVYRLPLMQKTTWKADDFTYIIHLTGYVFAAFASADTPFKKWEDVIAYAKAKPGKDHLWFDRLRHLAAPRHGNAGREVGCEVHARAVQGRRRSECSRCRRSRDARRQRHEHPPAGRRRQGALPQRLDRQSAFRSRPTSRPCRTSAIRTSSTRRWGLAGPKGMDPKVVAKFHDAFKKALEEQPVIDSLARFDMVPNYKGTADYNVAVQEQIKLEEALLKRIGMERKD